MITDQDITKLKKVFATKEDLNKMEKAFVKTFATKKDLRDMQKVFATKEALVDLRLEVGELKDTMLERFDSIDIKFERMFARMDRLDTKNAAGAVAIDRHNRQITALAKHTGAIIPEF